MPKVKVEVCFRAIVADHDFNLLAKHLPQLILAHFGGFILPGTELPGHVVGGIGKNLPCAKGDAAFDDGSYVLHCDCDDKVRLIAFKSGHFDLYDESTLQEVWVSSDLFYEILAKWSFKFKEVVGERMHYQ